MTGDNKQTKNGNLIGEFSNNHTNENITECANIKSELFEGDNIVVGKTDYGQSKLNLDK